VIVRYRYRAYPAKGQAEMLARTFGCARVVFNDALRLRDCAREAGEKVSDTEVQRRVITLAKQTPEREWLGEVASVALVQACQDARRAYRNWFDSMSGKRNGRKVGHPRFRSRKDNRQSVRFTRNGFALHGDRVYIAKVGELKVRWSRELPSQPSSVTALRLIRDNQAVYAEDLSVAGLARTRLAKSIHDAGWSQLLRLLAEKAEHYNRTFHRIGRFVPSSQVCSNCGVNDGPKPLNVRNWTCAECRSVHDRDVNAARNILAAGQAERLTASGERVNPPTQEVAA
jgi:transposase